MNQSAGYVYLIRDPDSGLVKIGCSKDVWHRLRQVGGVLLHAFPTDDHYALEKKLHQTFSTKHVRGEWFELSEEDIRTITLFLPTLTPESLPPPRAILVVQVDAGLKRRLLARSKRSGRKLNIEVARALRYYLDAQDKEYGTETNEEAE